MQHKDFKYRIKINAEVADVYAALTNPFTIQLWTGYTAVMSEVPGSDFELWDGDISGRNLEFVKDSKVVQEWEFGEQEDPSIVTLKLFPQGINKTQIELFHTNIPDEAYDDIVEGWKEYYLGAIKEFLEVQE
ncbi:MAG: SRPBCC domain-containing protein [Marinilabiliaceae bacterium]|nr:SRPBCC domain-containing protein [Marinilabiliaceae bacterium]